jgi:hypothetical protein
MGAYRMMPLQGTETMNRIMRARKWVGRVVPHMEGGYLGKIGNTYSRAPTREAAFEEVVAKHLGYPSADALHASNRVVRAANRERNARNHALASRFKAAINSGDMKGAIDVIDTVFGLPPKEGDK